MVTYMAGMVGREGVYEVETYSLQRQKTVEAANNKHLNTMEQKKRMEVIETKTVRCICSS